ncbi:MAG: HPr kinase/phosphatase C-terminal domain-containing protein [Dinoroseobacter sp.]|nr:HPr kinase/phosphatase C-terminal domain-containing protein [Dinoroseobacter sp.]
MARSASHSVSPSDQIIPATAIAEDGRAVLLTGPSGSGKSAIALQLIALGADLISDDQTALSRSDDLLIAAPAPNIFGRIEARGVGVLRANVLRRAQVALVVDLGSLETDRLPPWRTREILGLEMPCLHKVEGPHFPASILQYLKYGRSD